MRWLIFLSLLVLYSKSMVEQCKLGAIKPCQAHSSCGENGYCQCEEGWVLDCTTAAILIPEQAVNITLESPVTLFSVIPSEVSMYSSFIINICPGMDSMGFMVYLDTRDQARLEHLPQISFKTSATFNGCLNLETDTVSIQTQINNLPYQLLLSITAHPQTSITISAQQQTIQLLQIIYFVFAGVVVVGVIVGAGLCLWRDWRRRVQNQGHVHNDLTHFKEQMPIKKLSDLKKKNKKIECSICLQVIQEIETLRQTVCRHIFHSRCIDKWADTNLSCPNCRTSFHDDHLQTQNHDQESLSEDQSPPALRQPLIQ